MLFFILFIPVFLYLKTFKLDKSKFSTVNIICGLPGSGKTTALAAYTHSILKNKKLRKKGYRVFCNVPIHGAVPYDWKTHYGVYDMSNAAIFLDEAGIELDNRQFKTNFTPAKVEYLKLLRHRANFMMVFSQTWGDMDLKIRDMAGQIWICKRGLLPGVTCLVPVSKKIGVDEDTHQMMDMYYMRHPILRFFATQRLFRPLYYRYFDSFAAPALPPFPEVEPYNLLKPKKRLKDIALALKMKVRFRKSASAEVSEPTTSGMGAPQAQVKKVVHEDKASVVMRKIGASLRETKV